MKVKLVKSEWFQDYKLPSMFIAFPTCTFKCEKENEACSCHNSSLVGKETVDVDCEDLIRQYISNPITRAIVCGGLEPMDSFDELISLITILRLKYKNTDDVVIYTGYTLRECMSKGWIKILEALGNIIIKFGRYIPGDTPHYDNILGVYLASRNQLAMKF